MTADEIAEAIINGNRSAARAEIRGSDRPEVTTLEVLYALQHMIGLTEAHRAMRSLLVW